MSNNISTEEYQNLRREYEEAVKPAIEWLNKNKNPHTKIIIDTTSAEVVESTSIFNTEEFLRD